MAYIIRIPKSRKELAQDATRCHMPIVPSASPISQRPGTAGTEGTRAEAPSVPVDTCLIRAGMVISWERADLSKRRGVVNFLHIDTDGTTWAFVTLVDEWAAVNAKHVTKSEEGPTKA